MQILGQNQIKQFLHKQQRCCDLKKKLLNPQVSHMLAMEMEHGMATDDGSVNTVMFL